MSKTFNNNSESWQSVKDCLLSRIDPVAQTIAIKSNIVSVQGYPFATRSALLIDLIVDLRERYGPQILLVEPEFSDCGWAGALAKIDGFAEILKQYKVGLVRANREKKIKITDLVHMPFYLPQSWVEADMRINLANLTVHTHHGIKTVHGAALNLATICLRKDNDFSFFTKKDFISATEFDTQQLVTDIVKMQERFRCHHIVDASIVGYSDEHSPYIRQKDFDQILYSDRVEDIDTRLIKMLGTKNIYNFAVDN